MIDAAMATVPKIRIRGLHKSFGEKVVLDGIDLDVQEGPLLSLSVGPEVENPFSCVAFLD